MTLPINFGHNVALVGYKVTPSAPKTGDTIRIITEWEAIGEVMPRLTLFSHILGDPQTVVANMMPCLSPPKPCNRGIGSW